MDINTKILIFYLSLNDSEKRQFLNTIGDNNFRRLSKSANLDSIKKQLNSLLDKYEIKTDETDFDIAIMQVVRLIVKMARSNVELAKYIEYISGENVSRPEKRSKYELQGMLLGALEEAPRDKLYKMKNELFNRISFSKSYQENQSNLDKWFSIILKGSR